jgi:hypothetical protein
MLRHTRTPYVAGATDPLLLVSDPPSLGKGAPAAGCWQASAVETGGEGQTLTCRTILLPLLQEDRAPVVIQTLRASVP